MTPETFPGYMWIIVKILALLGIGLYTLFAGIMVRQEQLMSTVLEEQFEPILRVLTVIHFVASVAIFFAALILL